MAADLSRLLKPTKCGDWLGMFGPLVDSPTFTADINYIAGLGASLVRLLVPMDKLTAASQTYRNQYILPAITGCLNAGLLPMAVITGGPSGYTIASGSTGGTLVSDAGLNILDTLILVGLEDMFKAGMRIIESQNEWDGPGVSIPANIDPPRFVETHRLLYEMWHALGSKYGQTVIGITGGTSVAAFTYLGSPFYPLVAAQTFVQQRGCTALDGYGHHPYCFGSNPWASANETQVWNGCTKTTAIASVIQARRPHIRVWLTEVSWPDDVGAIGTESAAYARCAEDLQMFRYWQELGIAGPVFAFHSQKDGTAGFDNSHNFGIRRSTGVDKPTAGVIRDFAAQPYPSGAAPVLFPDAT
jgi:hypothetical protein